MSKSLTTVRQIRYDETTVCFNEHLLVIILFEPKLGVRRNWQVIEKDVEMILINNK